VTEIAGVRIGAEVSGYRVDELIGRGGMGEVYRAWDERLERNVALKILVPRLADDDAFRERLLRESRLAASLDHPNVVPVYDAGEAVGRFFLAMRFVEGTDLRAVLRGEGALAPERAIDIAAQVAGALDAAHEKGLVHRDVKPSNVLIDERGHCYLADFGLTQLASSQGQAPDESLLGTLDYVAPEQIRGSDVDRRADVYSLGCLLFECLTGEVPFPRPSEVATLYAHLEDDPPRPSERRPELPVGLDDVLGRAMAKDPDSRQPSCTALVEEARVALGLVGTGTRRLRLAVAAAAFVLLVAAVATAAILLTRAAPAQAGGSLIRIDPQSDKVTARSKVTARYRVSAHPGVITTSSGRVWLGDDRDSALWTLEPRTGELKRVTSLGEPKDLTALRGKIYVAADSTEISTAGTVTRYDAVTGVRERTLDLLSCAIAGGEGVVWSCGDDQVNKLSTGSGKLRVLRNLSLPYREPVPTAATGTVRPEFRDIAMGYGSLWVVRDPLERRLWRLDPISGRVLATIKLPFLPRTIATGEGHVWISAPLNDAVMRIDPKTNIISATIPTGHGTSGVAAGAGAVWVTNTLDGTVSQISLDTCLVVDEIDVGGRPQQVAVGAGGVWVSAEAR
jgi:streptogramin lyase/predicted Ser/Thr protein kinase